MKISKFYQNKPLPDVKWIRPNNITHGITIVTVNITNGLAPINVTVYYARTLDDKRFTEFICFSILFNSKRK